MKWFWLSISEERWSMRPFSVFPWQPCDVYKASIPQLGNQPYYSPVTNNQHSLPTTQHYILPHLPAISRVCAHVCAHVLMCVSWCAQVMMILFGHSELWALLVELLLAAYLSVSNLVNELYGQVVCWCYLGPLTLHWVDQLSNSERCFYPHGAMPQRWALNQLPPRQT